MHIGVGNFHKSHQAVYTDDVLSKGDSRWGIRGVSFRSARAEQQLAPQDCLYTVVTLSPEERAARIIGSIQEVITTIEDDGARRYLDAFADASTHVVTITATEKGYCSAPEGLDQSHPDVIHDVAHKNAWKSLPGLLVDGLVARRDADSGSITLISCDNMVHNGYMLERVVTDYAMLKEPELLPWLESHVSFPSTMVDRIAPATADEDLLFWSQELGYRDDGIVCCEPYTQWVIEDRFAGPRPPWDAAGALLVDDVTAYEQVKLRLLNAPHSASAYLGILTGHDFVHQVVADELLGQFLRRLVQEEIVPSVAAPDDLDLEHYSDQVLARFANSAVPYKTRQVGTDGSLKLPQRWVPIVRDRLRQRRPVPNLALAFAAWIAHLSDPAPDPIGSELQTLYQQKPGAEELIAAIFERTSVFDGLKDQQTEFTAAVAPALDSIRSLGVKTALAS